MSKSPRPVALIILDGWGYSEELESNAIAAANTPVWDRMWQAYAHSFIRTSGAAVGLPGDQMGNSEVGHLNLGAGRVVYQEFTRVSRSIKTGSFFNNATLTDAVDLAISSGKAVHVIGLLSPGGVHSHEDHIHAMVQLAVERGVGSVYLHAFLDGPDTPPRSAAASIQAMDDKFRELGNGRFASIIGRYYAMDRDHRWPRIQAAYDLITRGKADFEAQDAISERLPRGRPSFPSFRLGTPRPRNSRFATTVSTVRHRFGPVPVGSRSCLNSRFPSGSLGTREKTAF